MQCRPWAVSIRLRDANAGCRISRHLRNPNRFKVRQGSLLRLAGAIPLHPRSRSGRPEAQVGSALPPGWPLADSERHRGGNDCAVTCAAVERVHRSRKRPDQQLPWSGARLGHLRDDRIRSIVLDGYCAHGGSVFESGCDPHNCGFQAHRRHRPAGDTSSYLIGCTPKSDSRADNKLSPWQAGRAFPARCGGSLQTGGFSGGRVALSCRGFHRDITGVWGTQWAPGADPRSEADSRPIAR